MRAMPIGLLLLGLSGMYFIVRRTAGIGDVPPTSACAACMGLVGIGFLFADIYARVDRRLNQLPRPPYFVIDKTHGPCLELDADGSYESCQQFLSTLGTQFDAEYSKQLESGPRPDADKDKGYWNVTMFGQNFFVMRDRGYGICIWGPKPPADAAGILQVAAHFNAIEFITWQQRLARFLCRRVASIARNRGGGPTRG